MTTSMPRERAAAGAVTDGCRAISVRVEGEVSGHDDHAASSSSCSIASAASFSTTATTLNAIALSASS